MSFKKKICVIGGGVIGVTSALAVKEKFPNFNVTIFADNYTPNTTGDGSAGFWDPYLIQDTPDVDILRWGGATHKWMENFWKTDLSSEIGVSLIPVFRVSNDVESKEMPSWLSLVYAGRNLTHQELRKFNDDYCKKYRSGYSFLTYTCEPKYLLPYLMDKFKSLGGIVVKRKINNFNELADEGYEILINCAGINAGKLSGDSTVEPIRGQVARVKAPWIFGVFLDDNNYIIPNMESVILGGTSQVNDYDTKVKKIDSKFIKEGCQKIIPAIENAKLIDEWVGLRPGRKSIRLESEILVNKTGKKYTVIHNYGHGGSGVTLCWGCALDVVKILQNFFIQKVYFITSNL